MDPSAMTDRELEENLQRLRGEIAGAAYTEVLRQAQVSRNMSRIEEKPPVSHTGPSEETAWIVVGFVTAAATLACLWLTLPGAK